MRNYTEKTSIKLVILLILIFNSFSFISIINYTKANYDFNGYELKPRVYGKINGGVFLSIGNKYGVDSTPYNINYDIPNGTAIIYAALYIYIWGGDEYNSGSVTLSVNEKTLNKINLDGINDINENVLISTHGSYSVYYEITNEIVLNKENNISINTEGSSFDGRVYGALLLVIYNVSNQVIKFCFADGNEGLHYLIKGSSHDTCTMEFSDTYNSSEYTTSDFWISYCAGDSGDGDSLYFNNDVLGLDVADGSSGQSFDFDYFNVSEKIEEKNEIKIERNDESYLHPMNCLLISKYKTGLGNDSEDYIVFVQREFPNSDDNPFEGPLFQQVLLVIAVTMVFSLIIITQYIRKKKSKITPLEELEEKKNMNKK